MAQPIMSRKATLLSRCVDARRSLPRISLGAVLFVISVVIPIAASIVYYGFVASDRYVAESQFIVRSVSAKRITGLDTILKSIGLSATQDDAYAITNYLASRDVVHAVESQLPLREIFRRPEADFLARFPDPLSNSTFESLYEHFKTRVSAVRDSHTGITTLRVSTFRPEDSHALSLALIELSERLVNKMNERAQRDIIKGADEDVRRGQTELVNAQRDITEYRNKELIFDPSVASQGVVQLIGKLSAELAVNLAEISEASANSPTNPSLPSLRARTTAIRDQISAARDKLAGKDSSLAKKIAEYERLVMTREFAERKLASSLISLEGSKQDARRQQVYIEQIVQANQPDEATEPRRGRAILTTAFFSIIVFGLTWVVFAGAKEHASG